MPEILVVCTANICRSPVVEALLRERLEAAEPGVWRVSSAGTLALPGYGAAELSAELMGERGLDLSGHRSSRADEPHVEAADLVLCMEFGHKEALAIEFPSHRHKIHLLAEMAGDYHEVADPIGGPRPAYEAMVREVEGLIEHGLERIVKLGRANAARRGARA